MNRPPDSEAALAEVATLLGRARRLLFITGAGISADSGLPTYRGIGGLYQAGATPDGPIEDLLSGENFAKNPTPVWKYLSQLEESGRDARFNRGHEVIALMERRFEAVWVLTQNVDGFHRRAGSTGVIDIHGDIYQLRCTQCAFSTVVSSYSGLELPPTCPKCNAVLRPNVVLFGEMLPAEKLHTLAEIQRSGFDLVFSVGTSSLFPYVAAPIMEAKASGIPTVEINPDTTYLSAIVDYRISMSAATALDRLWAALNAN